MGNLLKSLLLTIVLLSLCTACMPNTQKITELLKQKYGVEFEVQKIGNRLATDKWDTMTAFCYPKERKEILFEAVMNADGELISDDYYVTLLEYEAKERIEERYHKGGIDATVNVSISHLSEDIDEMINLEQLLSQNPTLSLTFTTVMRSGANMRTVYETTVSLLEEYYSGNPQMALGTTIWTYDVQSYQKCAEEMNRVPYLGKTALEKNNPISVINVSKVDGKINISFDVFKEKVQG